MYVWLERNDDDGRRPGSGRSPVVTTSDWRHFSRTRVNYGVRELGWVDGREMEMSKGDGDCPATQPAFWGHELSGSMVIMTFSYGTTQSRPATFVVILFRSERDLIV